MWWKLRHWWGFDGPHENEHYGHDEEFNCEKFDFQTNGATYLRKHKNKAWNHMQSNALMHHASNSLVYATIHVGSTKGDFRRRKKYPFNCWKNYTCKECKDKVNMNEYCTKYSRL